jgi:hypothetical protein
MLTEAAIAMLGVLQNIAEQERGCSGHRGS